MARSFSLLLRLIHSLQITSQLEDNFQLPAALRYFGMTSLLSGIFQEDLVADEGHALRNLNFRIRTLLELNGGQPIESVIGDRSEEVGHSSTTFSHYDTVPRFIFVF